MTGSLLVWVTHSSASVFAVVEAKYPRTSLMENPQFALCSRCEMRICIKICHRIRPMCPSSTGVCFSTPGHGGDSKKANTPRCPRLAVSMRPSRSCITGIISNSCLTIDALRHALVHTSVSSCSTLPCGCTNAYSCCSYHPPRVKKQQKIFKKSKKLTTARSLATVILPWARIKRA